MTTLPAALTRSKPALATAFHSGMSRSKDFHGAASTGVAIGVVAGELSMGQKLCTIPGYLAKGGFVFIDSGAFLERKTGETPDFNSVLATYELIADPLDPIHEHVQRLYVVAPDKVGDQAVTLERLTLYRSRICALIDAGVQMIVPIQRGIMPAAEMLARVVALLGTRDFVAGIPSNKDALSLAECQTLQHHSFHILGRVQMNDDQAARIEALGALNPGAQITADANWLRSRMSTVCQLTDHYRAEQIHISGHDRFRLPSPRTAAVHHALQDERSWAGRA